MPAPWPPRVPDAPTLAEFRRAPILPLLVLLMACGIGRSQGVAFGALAGLAYGGLWLTRRPPGAVSLFVGAEAAWSLARIVFGAAGEGARGALREAGGLVVLTLVIAARPYVRGERATEELARWGVPNLRTALRFVLLVAAVGLANRDGWPLPLAFGLFPLFVGLSWPGAARVRLLSWQALAVAGAMLVLDGALNGPPLRWSLWPLAPMALVAMFGSDLDAEPAPAASSPGA